MPATNYTPIQIYRTTTASATPSAGNLADGELAINLTDEKLYFKNAAGVVKLLASNSGSLGSVTSVAVSGGTTGLTTSGGPITSSGTITLGGTLGVANGGTGATSLTSGYLVKGNGTSAVSASVVYDDGTNVGIGTSSPSARLHAQIGGSGQATPAALFFSNNDGFTPQSLVGLAIYNNLTSGFIDTNLVFGNSVNSYFAIGHHNGTSYAERMRLDSSGNLGIGTSSPAERLSVWGSGTTSTIADFTNGVNANFQIKSASALITVGSSATAPLAFQTNATERMRIDSSGNVGIGTSSPGAKLDVAGTGYFSDDVTISRTNTAGSLSGMTITNAGTTAAYAGININSGTVTAQLFNDAAGNAVVAGTVLRTSSNHPLVFGTNAAERMRIDSSGNVGIGTSSPGAKLHVVGNTYVQSGTIFTDAVTSYGGTSLSINGGNTLISLTSGTERMRIDSSGNVGLGVTPSAWSWGGRVIDGTNNMVVSAGGNNLINAANAFWNGTAWTYKTTSQATRYEQNSGVHQWFTAPSGTAGNAISFTQAMALSASQKLSIGTSSTDIAVAYLVTQSASDVDNIRMAEAGVTSQAPGIRASGDALVLKTSGTERARIDASGNLLVGKTADVLANAGHYFGAGGSYTATRSNDPVGYLNRLGSDGDILTFWRSTVQVGSVSVTTTATAYNTSSDYRLKDIDGPIQNSGAYIDALKPVQGSWKADGSRFIGLIAHEVQEVSETQIATGTKDGEEMQAMDYSAPEIIANLIAELQSLRARVAQLEGK